MSERTPPSLKWLIDQRNKLAGTLKAIDADRIFLENQLAQLAKHEAKTVRDLASIDRVFSLHVVLLDPTQIEPKKAAFSERVFKKHGDLSKHIIRALRTHDDWMTTYAVVAAILVDLQAQGRAEKFAYCYVYKNVRRRLGKMKKLGIVERMDVESGPGCYPRAAWRALQIT
jgi:hypothetical protein